MRPALPAGSGRLQAAGTARAVALAREPGRALQAAQVLQMSGRPLSAAALLHRGRGCRRRRSVSFQRQPAPLPARLTQSRLWRGSLLGGICLELRFGLARGCGNADAAPGSPPRRTHPLPVHGLWCAQHSPWKSEEPGWSTKR